MHAELPVDSIRPEDPVDGIAGVRPNTHVPEEMGLSCKSASFIPMWTSPGFRAEPARDPVRFTMRFHLYLNGTAGSAHHPAQGQQLQAAKSLQSQPLQPSKGAKRSGFSRANRSRYSW